MFYIRSLILYWASHKWLRSTYNFCVYTHFYLINVFSGLQKLSKHKVYGTMYLLSSLRLFRTASRNNRNCSYLLNRSARTRNKGRSPVTDRPKWFSDRPYFIMGGHFDRPLFLTTLNNSRYSTQNCFDRFIDKLPENLLIHWVYQHS